MRAMTRTSDHASENNKRRKQTTKGSRGDSATWQTITHRNCIHIQQDTVAANKMTKCSLNKGFGHAQLCRRQTRIMAYHNNNRTMSLNFGQNKLPPQQTMRATRRTGDYDSAKTWRLWTAQHTDSSKLLTRRVTEKRQPIRWYEQAIMEAKTYRCNNDRGVMTKPTKILQFKNKHTQEVPQKPNRAEGVSTNSLQLKPEDANVSSTHNYGWADNKIICSVAASSLRKPNTQK